MRSVLRWPSSVLILLTAVIIGKADGKFDLQLQKVDLPEMGTVTRCQLRTDKGTYGFMPPYHWQIEADTDAKRLNLTSPERSLITVRTLTPEEDAADKSGTARFHELLTKRYPNAKIIEEFECASGGSAGRGFDLEVEGNAGPRLLFRTIFVPISGEVIEFHLAARPDWFRKDVVILSSLLTSFQPISLASKGSDEGDR
jgi:hypothetical protein